MAEALARIQHFDWIAHHAAAGGDRLALVELATGRRYTYAALNERVARLASHLRQVGGVRAGDRVAALALNCAALVELMFACSRIGAVYLPLNWRLTVAELSYILQDAEPALLAIDEDNAVKGVALQDQGFTGQLLHLPGQDPRAYERLLADAEPEARHATVHHDDVQMLMYTSGTTGFPKAALITYGMVFWNAINVGLPALVSPEARLLAVMPMFHTGGLNLFANPVFHAGGSVALMRSFNAGTMLAALSDPDLAITHTFAVPTAYQAMMQHSSFADVDLSRLRFVCVGGAATPPHVLEKWAARGVPLANGYGMTETSPAVTLLLPRDALRKRGSVGRPLLHTQIRIVDASGRDVPVGEPGELWVRGPNVTPGYWRNEKASADAFADGWLKTGDIVRRDADGFCYVIDRAKDLYISGGENVYPAEVEQVISQLAGVAESAVIGIPDERWGETGIAFVSFEPGIVLEEALVIEHCAAHLARFKVPRRILFVDSLPRTSTGKIHKPTLRQRLDPGGTG